jgi:hypothetical protein
MSRIGKQRHGMGIKTDDALKNNISGIQYYANYKRGICCMCRRQPAMMVVTGMIGMMIGMCHIYCITANIVQPVNNTVLSIVRTSFAEPVFKVNFVP